MRYKFIIPMLYIFSTLSLFSEENKLGDILQKNDERNPVSTPVQEKIEIKKKSRFIFKDTYKTKDGDLIDEDSQKKESKKYVYENKPKFKFKFTSGTGYSNRVDSQDTASSYGGSSNVGGKGAGRH